MRIKLTGFNYLFGLLVAFGAGFALRRQVEPAQAVVRLRYQNLSADEQWEVKRDLYYHLYPAKAAGSFEGVLGKPCAATTEARNEDIEGARRFEIDKPYNSNSAKRAEKNRHSLSIVFVAIVAFGIFAPIALLFAHAREASIAALVLVPSLAIATLLIQMGALSSRWRIFFRCSFTAIGFIYGGSLFFAHALTLIEAVLATIGIAFACLIDIFTPRREDEVRGSVPTS